MILAQFLADAAARFKAADISTPALDAQVLTAFVLGQNRAWILAHDDVELTDNQLGQLKILVQKRSGRMPIAYLTGHQEFYGRDFKVTPDVLIPRPETEGIIEMIKKFAPQDGRLLDIGTGSGAIAITAALELPVLQVEACDIGQPALQIAKQNAQNLDAKIHFFRSDLLSNATGRFDVITANLPYVDASWQRSAETDFEPQTALFAGDGGLELIKKLLEQAPRHLKPSGYLILEADPRQHRQITSPYFKMTAKDGFVVALQLA